MYKSNNGSFEGLHSNIDFVVPEPKFGSDMDIESSAEAAEAIARAERSGEDTDALIAAEIERMELMMSSSVSGDDVEELS